MATVGTTPLTGDIKNRKEETKYGVTFHNFPEVPATELAESAALVNDYAQSGKRIGAQLLAVDKDKDGVVTAAAIMAAAGSSPTDKWVTIKDLVGTTTDITPA